jgi:hypothetical protein
MKVVRALLAAALSTSCLVCGSAVSAEVTRHYAFGAAGACTPFAPTSKVRYSSLGLRNAGTSQFYAACSMPGAYNEVRIGAYETHISLSNRGVTPQKVACSLRAGPVWDDANSQPTYPQSLTVEPGTQAFFTWSAADMGAGPEHRIANPNFTCTVKPGIEIGHIVLRFAEDFGE